MEAWTQLPRAYSRAGAATSVSEVQPLRVLHAVCACSTGMRFLPLGAAFVAPG
jgi:hypothetical protein